MTGRQTSKQIDDAAARWAAHIDRAPLSAEDESALGQWLSSDPRHLGALAKAQAVSIHMERARALGPHFNPERFSSDNGGTGLTRRRALMLGTAASAAAAATIVLVMQHLSAGPPDRRFATERGETKTVPLEDGSIITLNTSSQVDVSFAPRQRTVRLVRGEGLFDVAKDSARPFVVEAGAAIVRAVGTSFAVLLLPKRPMALLVREGVVELAMQHGTAGQPIRLPANMRAIAPENAPITAEAVSPQEIDRALIWREGRIAFEGNSLAEAAEMFARYSDTRMVFADPYIAGLKITGLFVANDPVGFCRAVALSLGIHMRVGDGEIVLTR